MKWSSIPIPFSIHPAKYHASLQAAVSAPLTDEKMVAISTVEKNCRLIKGQIFLLKDDQDWQDLWDLDGIVAS